ncbi:BTAD domain-containing putative transcriptional regulator [Glycomyces luteolus]|uniref:BTAD domain-containing putative transcriptional regulator n=1 Tax=Glycomyces luteolus TaxID=2670330 RepID=A0A9X3PCG5_9ACTN|nr:BTAD domain-containing putative transcriptional regulator [Glycomyces luteolus]MDA1361217.1 BTAD domain-containing putative transcriptional regulator [Glycomyces luteolus]
MRIGLLGAFHVHVGDETLEVPGARSRALLAALALEPGRIVPRTRLVDWIWGEEPPSDEANALQVLVSRLRKALPKGAVESKAGGYLLAVEPDAVDVSRFEAMVAKARNAEDAEKAELLREALGLWRGTAMEGISLLGSKAFDAVVVGLNERYVSVLGDRVDAEVRLGRGADLVTELTDLVAKYPMREGFVAALMRALAEAGRGAEALTAYQQLAERLGEELGVDPSAELSALNIALLRGEIGGRTENRRTNLRAELTAFVGKEDDVAAVADLASRHRLVTLHGEGGAGKTRLAVETARSMLGDLPDGAWLVELATLDAESELAQAVLTAIGLRDQQGAAGGDATERLVAAIRDRVMLLVLDNCEHVIEEVSAFTDRLLGESRSLRIIATSREPLGITGEALWQVEPLALPAEGASAQEAAASPAVRLLRDRAEAVRRNIGGDEATLSTMARICRALDGMPLAIELAAARLRTMSVAQLADRIDDRFQLLTGGSRTAMAHHRTLRAVVDWSWDLLSETERELLRRLSVFTGGVSLEAAERVCPDGEYALDLLTALTEKSLLRADGDGEPRYRMLNTIREYAAQRLTEDGDPAAARRAHLAYVTELTEAADAHLRGSDQLTWLSALETEHDNINAALRTAIGDGWAAEAMRLVGAAGWYWYLSGHRAEGTELAIAAGSLEGEVPDDIRAVSGTIVAMFLTSGYGGDQYQAQEWIQTANAAAERSSSRHQMLAFIAPLARMLEAPKDFLAAFDPLVAGTDPWVRAQARLARGRLRLVLGSDETDVDSDVELALTEFRAIGDRWGVSSAISFLAERTAARGEFAKACKQIDEAAAALAELGSTEEVISARARQAQLYWLHGDERASASALAQAEALAAGISWPGTIAELTFAKAHLARWRGDLDEARDLVSTVAARPADDGVGIQFAVLDFSGYLTDDLDRARGLRREALAAGVGLSYPPMIAQALIGIADLAVRQGKDVEAVRLLAAADVVRGAVDLTLFDAVRIAEDTRNRLGEAAFGEAAGVGREQDWNELVEAVLGS